MGHIHTADNRVFIAGRKAMHDVRLQLTVHRTADAEPRYVVDLRSCREDGLEYPAAFISRDPAKAVAFVTDRATAADIVNHLIPAGAEAIDHLHRTLRLFREDLQGFIDAAARPRADVVLDLERDMSPMFDRRTGSCMVHYKLVRKTDGFRGAIALRRDGGAPTVLQLRGTDPSAIATQLTDRALVESVTAFFGDELHTAATMVKSALKLTFSNATAEVAQ